LASIPVAPLTREHFPDFAKFVETAAPGGWPCGADRPWTLADADRAAAQVLRVFPDLDLFGVQVGQAQVETIDQHGRVVRHETHYDAAGINPWNALAYWLTIINTNVWYTIRQQALEIIIDPGGAWKLPPAAPEVRYLDAWCLHFLGKFDGAEQSSEPTPAPSSATPVATSASSPASTGSGLPDNPASAKATPVWLHPKEYAKNYHATVSDTERSGRHAEAQARGRKLFEAGNPERIDRDGLRKAIKDTWPDDKPKHRNHPKRGKTASPPEQ
jgi:hypothetical protein